MQCPLSPPGGTGEPCDSIGSERRKRHMCYKAFETRAHCAVQDWATRGHGPMVTGEREKLRYIERYIMTSVSRDLPPILVSPRTPEDPDTDGDRMVPLNIELRRDINDQGCPSAKFIILFKLNAGRQLSRCSAAWPTPAPRMTTYSTRRWAPRAGKDRSCTMPLLFVCTDVGTGIRRAHICHASKRGRPT